MNPSLAIHWNRRRRCPPNQCSRRSSPRSRAKWWERPQRAPGSGPGRCPQRCTPSRRQRRPGLCPHRHRRSWCLLMIVAVRGSVCCAAGPRSPAHLILPDPYASPLSQPQPGVWLSAVVPPTCASPVPAHPANQPGQFAVGIRSRSRSCRKTKHKIKRMLPGHVVSQTVKPLGSGELYESITVKQLSASQPSTNSRDGRGMSPRKATSILRGDGSFPVFREHLFLLTLLVASHLFFFLVFAVLKESALTGPGDRTAMCEAGAA